MALAKDLIQSFRKNRLSVGSGWRAFFAPYNAVLGTAQADTTQGPKILNMASGPFNDSALPAGWYDLGWIKDYGVTPQTKNGLVRSGYRGAVRTIYRGQIGEILDFKFREMTRMATKIATGSQVFNILYSGQASVVGPLSASGSVITNMSSYDANTPSVTVAASSGFSIGDYIVVDEDYDGVSYGLVGSNGATVFQGEVTDVDYIRRTSDFVARITDIQSNVLTIDHKFVGGGAGNPTPVTEPPAGSKVQKMIGWAPREGGTFVTEWSALFLMNTMDGGQHAWYYPHLAPNVFRAFASWPLEDAGTTDLAGQDMDCSLHALAFDDPLDGETVVCYRAYYPPPNALISIGE